MSSNSYRNLCTEFYDIDKPSAPPRALEFYLRAAQRAGGAVLEPMCGTGRFLVPLAERGIDIDGTDASPNMLEACREKCRRHGIKPGVHQQFLHELELPRRYALVMIPAGSFGLLTDAARIRQSLQRIRAHLEPGGTFVLELERHRPQPSGGSQWGGRWVTRPDGAKIIISWLPRYDADMRITRSIHRYDLINAEGRLLETEFEEFDLLTYEPEGARAMLEDAGFHEIRVTQPYTGRAPESDDEEFVVECTAPA